MVLVIVVIVVVIVTWESKASSSSSLTERQTGTELGNKLMKTNPGEKKWTMLGAMGFLAETGTTVGYGTLTPQTDEGKLLTVFIIVVMVPLVGFVCGCFGTGIQ